MDIYGFNAYAYNRPDELAKQMYAQQALATYNRPTEPHVMPEPSGAPWNAGGLPWGLPSPPQLVQFTGQPMEPQPGPSYSTISHCKRKSLDAQPVIPAKQLITEEKMAAHLNGLHISSDYTEHTLASEELMDFGTETESVNTRNKIKGHKVVLSEELKRLQQEPLLPAALIERLQKPCMSLMVWKPKEDIILEKIKEENANTDDKTTEINDTPVRRNGVLVGDLGMDVEM